MRGKSSIYNRWRLLLGRCLVDLNKLRPSHLIRLLPNALEHVWTSCQRVLKLFNHLVSLLLNDPRIPCERRWLLVLRALLVVHCRRVDIQIVVLRAHQVFVPFKLGIRRGQIAYVRFCCSGWGVRLVPRPVVVVRHSEIASLWAKSPCDILSH